MASRGKKLVSLALTHSGETPELQHEVGGEIYDEMSQHSQLPTSSTVEHEISLHPQPSASSAIDSQRSISAIGCDESLQYSQPSTSSTLKPVPKNCPSSPAASRRAYYLSSSESEPFQDSGESYVPSEDILSEDEQSTQSSGHDEVMIDANADGAEEVPTDENADVDADQWEPCRDIPVNFQFTGNGGIKVDTIDLSDPYKTYRHFLNDEVLDIIVLETNRYAAQYIQSHNLRPRSIFRKWKDTNRSEIKKFFAILIVMGIHHLPQMRLYWSSNNMYGNILIQKIMKRDRFDCLLKFFHLSNNEDPLADTDRLFKLKHIVNLLCDKFKETLSPAENIVIDESMVPWRGRLVFRQYLPAKAHKYGVKLYKICTPQGYTFDMRIYAGKNAEMALNNDHGHTYNVCMDLLQDLLNEGRTLYIDNFYTSVQLCKTLLNCKTYVCGTLRQNRKGNPPTVCKKKLRKGEVFGEQNQNGIRVVKWLDKRPVLMISTVPSHKAELNATGKKNRKGEDTFKPQAVIDYNKAKKGVDISDQMSSYYTCLRKSIKWYRKVFFEIVLGTCIVNSWVMYNDYGRNEKKMTMLQFREKVARGLLEEEVEENIEPEDIAANVLEQRVTKRPRINSGITHHKMQKYEGTVRMTRKRCTSCYQKLQNTSGVKEARNKAKRVSTFCNDCPGQPTLCLQCFNEKHK